MKKSEIKSFLIRIDDKITKLINTKGNKDPFRRKKYSAIHFDNSMTAQELLVEAARFDTINNFVDKNRHSASPLKPTYQIAMKIYMLIRKIAARLFHILKKILNALGV